MLRVKIPVGDKKLEAEGDTEAELETAVKVALRVAESWSTPSSRNQLREKEFPKDEDKKEERVEEVSDSPSTQGGKPLKEKKFIPDIPDLPPSGYISPKYDGLKKREQLCLALCDLNVNYRHEEASAKQIITHLETTGGEFRSKAKDRPASSRQIMRTAENFISTGTGWKAKKEAINDFVARGRLWVKNSPPETDETSRGDEGETKHAEGVVGGITERTPPSLDED